jgi:RNA polymerase sigma-70 factor (ECF subfamily)
LAGSLKKPSGGSVRRVSQEGQEVITLVVFEGMAYEQVATRLGCAIGTIKSRLNRARRKLAAEMDAPTKAEGTSSVPRLRSGLKFDWMIDV